MSKSIGHILGDTPYVDPKEYLTGYRNDGLDEMISWHLVPENYRNNFLQYAQNNYANTATDALYANNPN